MSEEKKGNYMDVVRGEFCQMAVNYGVDASVAQELAGYLLGKMMSSWKNGLRVGRTQPQRAPVAA